jgi:uncharacterized protein YndB with AHSA1/START domain
MAKSQVIEHMVSIDIRAPVDRVWSEITKTGEVQRPLYNTILDSDLKPGSPVKYLSPDRKRIFVIGRVIDVDPPTMLRHTYMFTSKDEPPTLVTWNLESIDDGCRVTVTHTGWTEEHKAPEKSAGGWREILGLLKAEVETGAIPLKTRVMYSMMNRMMWMMPKTTMAPNAVALLEKWQHREAGFENAEN